MTEHAPRYPESSSPPPRLHRSIPVQTPEDSASPRLLPVTDRAPQPSVSAAAVRSHPADPLPPVDGEKMQSTGASGNIRGPCIQTD
ncbi:hypothetical protein ROHU_005840 [Labeo rohita]|uniref:Uncharacterized protein n=1 Tax=Labeo rohita TaxID=84645 RepID=A0A498N0H2_LABRO|nr:hypothetical protein ROHU_005840 [Labeo rohita]